MPLTADALRPKPPNPDDLNAAIGYTSISKLLADKANSKGSLAAAFVRACEYFGVKPDELLDRIRFQRSQCLATLAPLVSLLDDCVQTSKLPHCDFGRPWELGYAALMPELTPLRSIARLLCVQARLEREAGQSVPARGRLLAAARISSHLRSGRTATEATVSAACGLSVLSAYRDIMDSSPGDPFWLDAASRIDEAFGPSIDLRPIVEGELVTALYSLQLVSSDEGMREMGFKDEDIVGNRANVTFRHRAETALLREYRAMWEGWPKPPADLPSLQRAIGDREQRATLALEQSSGALGGLGSGPAGPGCSRPRPIARRSFWPSAG